jgi:hypothetical protein
LVPLCFFSFSQSHYFLLFLFFLFFIFSLNFLFFSFFFFSSNGWILYPQSQHFNKKKFWRRWGDWVWK